MQTLKKLTWVEIKLFVREPMTMVFTFALPLIFLFVMGGVFGNTPDPEEEIFRGVGATDYYVPAYIGLVILHRCGSPAGTPDSLPRAGHTETLSCLWHICLDSLRLTGGC